MTDEELEKRIIEELLEMADERERELEEWARKHPEEDAILQEIAKNLWEKLKKQLSLM